jgi:hypothetical protein
MQEAAMHFTINSPHVVRETFDDDEVVIVNLNSGSYYSLEKVAAEIWNLIENDTALDEILTALILRYEKDDVDIETTVRQFFHDLQAEDLILPVEPRGAESRDATAKATPEAVAPKLSFEAPVLHKYTDMQELLVLDPIHEVDDSGWPKSRAGSAKDE